MSQTQLTGIRLLNSIQRIPSELKISFPLDFGRRNVLAYSIGQQFDIANNQGSGRRPQITVGPGERIPFIPVVSRQHEYFVDLG